MRRAESDAITIVLRNSMLCLLCLLMRGVLSAPSAKFGKLDFPFYFADIFARPIIVAFAVGTLQTDKIWLGHTRLLCSVKLKIKNEKFKLTEKIQKLCSSPRRESNSRLILTMDLFCR